LWGDVQSGRRWQAGLKSSLRYVGRVYEEDVFYVLHQVKKKMCRYYRSLDFEIDYGQGVDRAILERDSYFNKL